MSQEELSKVFYPFYTTKERGTGLGLSIAYRIVEEHQGRLTIQSTPGIGTTFEIILPKAYGT
jgi:signal transduction histidine kinase